MDWLALVTPPLIWAKTAWLSPFLKTYRHRRSGMLSLVTGGFIFAALRLDEASFPALLGAAAFALAAMFATLLWPPRVAATRRAVR